MRISGPFCNVRQKTIIREDNGKTHSVQSDGDRTALGILYNQNLTSKQGGMSAKLTGDHSASVVDDTLVVLVRAMRKVHAHWGSKVSHGQI